MILHQVREPLAVIDSLLDLGLFASEFTDEIHRPWRRFLESHFQLFGDPLVDAMRFYVQWNERCEAHADLRIRIEDQCPLIPEFVEELYPGKGALVASHLPRVSTQPEFQGRAAGETDPGRGLVRRRPSRGRSARFADGDGGTLRLCQIGVMSCLAA